ncbi:MAG: hypothetical protein AAB484_02865 [Patescibacteria group bacterium]
MNIHKYVSKIKILARILDKRDLYTILIVIFVGLGSFFLGKISSIETNRKPITIERGDWISPESISSTLPNLKPNLNKGVYIGSKSGTKYHLLTCPGAKQINEANKIWFSSKIEAEKAGYSPAGNCKGI